MARINSYNLDLIITNEDLILGSSYEGTFNGVAKYATRNYRLEDLAEFFTGYDFNAGLSLETLNGQVSAVQSDISTINSSISSLTSSIATNASNISSNTSSISGLSSSISTNASNISSLSSSIQSLSNSLSTTQSTVSTISSNIANRAQWDEAYSWGDHSAQNYLTSVTINETDPVFSSSAASNVTNAKISNWDAAYQEAITGFDIQQNADGSQKTITLTRRDNTILTGTAPDIYGIPSGTFTDTNYYLTSGSFSAGQLRLTRQGISGTVDISGFDERYSLKDHAHSNYAFAGHDHAGVYSPVAHTHLAADITDLSSWFSTYGFVPVTGGNFTGTVGFSTSTNPSISSTISSSTFALQAISSAIPTMGYSGLYLNSTNAFELILKDANGNSNVFLSADGTSTIGGNTIWHSGNLSTGNFLSTSGGTMTGLLNVNTTGTGISVNVPSNNWAIRASSLANNLNASGLFISPTDNVSLYLRDASGTIQTQINSSTSSSFNYGITTGGSITVGTNANITGGVYVSGNIAQISGASPRLAIIEDSIENWYLIADNGSLSVRKNNTGDSKFVFDASGTMSVRDQIALRNFTSTSNTERFQIEPADYGVGNPRLYIKKESDANLYSIGLTDGTNNSGRILHNADLISANEEFSCSSVIFSQTSSIANALSFWGSDGTDGFMPNRSEYLGINRPSLMLTRHTSGSSNYAYTTGLSAIFKGNNITESFLFDKPNSTNLELQVGFPISTSSITWGKLAHSKSSDFQFENSIGVESLYFEDILSATSNANNIDSFMNFGTDGRCGIYSIKTTNASTNNYPYDSSVGADPIGDGQAVIFKATDSDSQSANDATFSIFNTSLSGPSGESMPGLLWFGQYNPSAATKWEWSRLVHTKASFEWVGFTLTAQNFILNSDRRLKENIEDIRPRGDVNWRQFEMGGKLRYGVVADEIEDIYPEFVETGDSGYKSVSYIDILVAENAKLRDRVSELEKDIEIIKKMLTK